MIFLFPNEHSGKEYRHRHHIHPEVKGLPDIPGSKGIHFTGVVPKVAHKIGYDLHQGKCRQDKESRVENDAFEIFPGNRQALSEGKRLLV